MSNEDKRDQYVNKSITLPFKDSPQGGKQETDDSWYDPDLIRESLSSSGQVSDYGDLKSIHTQMNAARASLYRIVSEQADTDRSLSVAEQQYKRSWNRSYIGASGTDKIRSTMADIENEELQNKLIELQIRSKELARRAQFLRDDLKASESLSNDYRQLIRSTS